MFARKGIRIELHLMSAVAIPKLKISPHASARGATTTICGREKLIKGIKIMFRLFKYSIMVWGLSSTLAYAASCQETSNWPPSSIVQPYTYEHADHLWWGGEAGNGWGQSGFPSAQAAWDWWLALHQQRYPTQVCSQIPHLGAGVGGYVQGWIQFLCREPSNGGEWRSWPGEPVHSYCPAGFTANLTTGTCDKQQACPSGTVDVGTGCSTTKEDGVCYYRVVNGIVEKDD